MSISANRDHQLSHETVGFDYSRVVASARKQVQEETRAIRRLVMATADNIIQIGLRLQSVRECIGRRHFQSWLRAEFRWSQSIASNYMRAAAAFRDIECLDRFQPSALYVLARHKAAGGARTEAILRAESGEIITKASAELIVQHHTTENRDHKRTVVARVRTSIRRIKVDIRILDFRELQEITQQVACLLTELRGNMHSGAPGPAG